VDPLKIRKDLLTKTDAESIKWLAEGVINGEQKHIISDGLLAGLWALHKLEELARTVDREDRELSKPESILKKIYDQKHYNARVRDPKKDPFMTNGVKLRFAYSLIEQYYEDTYDIDLS